MNTPKLHLKNTEISELILKKDFATLKAVKKSLIASILSKYKRGMVADFELRNAITNWVNEDLATLLRFLGIDTPTLGYDKSVEFVEDYSNWIADESIRASWHTVQTESGFSAEEILATLQALYIPPALLKTLSPDLSGEVYEQASAQLLNEREQCIEELQASLLA